MKAFWIILHALRQVFGNLGQALALSVLPLMLGFMTTLFLMGFVYYWSEPGLAPLMMTLVTWN